MNSTVSPLNTLIETIIEKGNITQEEQRTINMLATKIAVNQSESSSVNKLISLISEGKIEVTN
ncbi:MAG: hypothetical protein LBE20_06020 [Deltaproteobacteria bacterium]|jgi:hypothetical protein|nr:hypothetical protein [Deltaproteobacteria bacterium]